MFCIYVLLIVGITVILYFVFFWRKTRVVDVTEKKREQKTSKEKSKVKISVIENAYGQINIFCEDLQGRRLGELLATYAGKDLRDSEQMAYTVHLEQLLVRRSERKRGIATLMVKYLIGQMLSIEEKEVISFRYIYGEIGNTGTDDPVKSIPFYKSLHGMPYASGKELCFEHRKSSGMDGLDQFYYWVKGEHYESSNNNENDVRKKEI